MDETSLCETTKVCLFQLVHDIHEPPHDKTNKMAVRPANTQISLGIRPV